MTDEERKRKAAAYQREYREKNRYKVNEYNRQYLRAWRKRPGNKEKQQKYAVSYWIKKIAEMEQD